MTHLRSFEEFLDVGVVKRQRISLARAESLAEGAGKRKIFIDETASKVGIRDENANYFVELAYDTIMELIRARMFADGFKASGLSAHEAEVSYMRKLGFAEPDVKFTNELRYFRNGIVYYGERVDAAYAKAVLNFLKTIYPKLKSLVR